MKQKTLFILLFTLLTIFAFAQKTPDLLLPTCHEKITSVEYSPDGNYILTQGFDNEIKIWNIETGRLLFERSPDGILYDFKNGDYRTERINSIFSVIPSLSEKRKDIKKGNKVNVLLHSRLVAGTGLEPVTFGL